MSGIPWATGAYETPRSYDSDYVSWAVWSDGTGRDKTRITVTLYDTSRVNPFYGLPGVQIGEYNLITSNEAFEFQLKNIQNDRMVRSVPNFEVVRKSGNVDRYQYNCFEVPIRSYIQQTYTYREHFIVEGTIELDERPRLQKRLPQSYDGSGALAKLVEVFIKGHRTPIVYETNTNKVKFSLHDSPLLNKLSSLMVCAWAGKHDLSIQVKKSE